MARGRMISKSIGSSRKYTALYTVAGRLTEFCHSLFPLLVVSADDFGRQDGDALTIKHAVFPLSRRSEHDFEEALNALATVGLIQRYVVEGKAYLRILKFDEHQPGLLSKRTRSKIPDPPTVQNQQVTESDGDSVLTKPNLTQPNLTEPNLTDRDGESPASAQRQDPGLQRKDRERGFERFWSEYPKKVGKDAARQEWQRLAPDNDLTERILAAVTEQRASAQWLKEGGQFIPHPRTWLHQGRWQDEPVHTVGPTLMPKTQGNAAALARFAARDRRA